ncbi:hypothetical protein [Peribacillus sp. NPDC096540]|uniref:hypothetical protein n=1 Tax=Peribacillus sp. NPDC096540 TaxID=3390612 RepID=UPI003CFE82D9
MKPKVYITRPVPAEVEAYIAQDFPKQNGREISTEKGISFIRFERILFELLN